MALNRTEAARLVALAASVVVWVACGGSEAVEERWAALEVPEPEIVFLGDWTDGERAAITREVKRVQVSFAERFGEVTSEFTLYISTDFDALNDAYRERVDPDGQRRGVELPEWLPCGGVAWRAAIFISLERCAENEKAHGGPIAHEYFHILQNHLGGVAGADNVWPTWLIEGSAEYASAHHAEEQGRASVTWRREVSRLVWSGLGRPLPGPYDAAVSSMFIGDAYTSLVYDVGFLGIEWLIERRGAKALMEFFRLGGGRREFSEAFDMSPDEFVEAFEEHRQQVALPFEWNSVGTVLDANSRPVAYAQVRALVWLGDEKIAVAGATTNSEGVFRLAGPGNGYSLGLFLTCPGGNTVYGPRVFAGERGENGFVPDADGLRETDEQGAEPFSGEERNRLGILIELPETKAALLERHCGP
ncbi:MAG: hypothetical protein OXE43_00660 [Chloroflexi bacterium]|nr:hypothetical protein [Chloroflexota bacterium]